MKLLLDFGLLVLIWIVQLIIYPSFAYYSHKELIVWHSKYTLMITVIVLPLMVGQLLIHGYGTIQHTSLINVLSLILVCSTWVITFGWAVPLHNQIDAGNDIETVVNKLVKVNWPRTILWSAIFLISLYASIKNSALPY